MPGPETGLVVGIKHLITYVAVPIIALLAWVARRLHTRVDRLEEKVSDMDKRQAVQESQLDDMSSDIKEMRKDIKEHHTESNKKLNKLLECMYKHYQDKE